MDRGATTPKAQASWGVLAGSTFVKKVGATEIEPVESEPAATQQICAVVFPEAKLERPPRRLQRTSDYARVPTASRYSCSKRAASGVPRFHSSQKASTASLNSASRPLLRAFVWATMVGPYRSLKCSP
jgi:hypothetical protein